MKKPWARPELIVLVRGTPDEAVLKACKGPRGENYGQGPGSWLGNDCYYENRGPCESMSTT